MEATFHLWYKGTFNMIRQRDIDYVFCVPTSISLVITEI